MLTVEGQVDAPMLILIAAWTSAELTVESPVRAHGLVWAQTDVENKNRPTVTAGIDGLRI
jgi:hypothetical protein